MAKKIIKYCVLIISYLFFSYPIKENLGRGNILSIIFTGIIFLILYKVIIREKKP